MAQEWLRPLPKIVMPDPFHDEFLLGDRPELSHLGITLTTEACAVSEDNSLTNYIRRENERLAAVKKKEKFSHIKRAKNAGSFVFRHKVAAITGATLVSAAVVSGRLLRRK